LHRDLGRVRNKIEFSVKNNFIVRVELGFEDDATDKQPEPGAAASRQIE
jgi:hypothetical protein